MAGVGEAWLCAPSPLPASTQHLNGQFETNFVEMNGEGKDHSSSNQFSNSFHNDYHCCVLTGGFVVVFCWLRGAEKRECFPVTNKCYILLYNKFLFYNKSKIMHSGSIQTAATLCVCSKNGLNAILSL